MIINIKQKKIKINLKSNLICKMYVSNKTIKNTTLCKSLKVSNVSLRDGNECQLLNLLAATGKYSCLTHNRPKATIVAIGCKGINTDTLFLRIFFAIPIHFF